MPMHSWAETEKYNLKKSNFFNSWALKWTNLKYHPWDNQNCTSFCGGFFFHVYSNMTQQWADYAAFIHAFSKCQRAAGPDTNFSGVFSFQMQEHSHCLWAKCSLMPLWATGFSGVATSCSTSGFVLSLLSNIQLYANELQLSAFPMLTFLPSSPRKLDHLIICSSCCFKAVKGVQGICL